MDKLKFLADELNKIKAKGQYRRVETSLLKSLNQIERKGKTLVNFCSNDYLGLAHHEELKRKSMKATQIYGTGSTASRLVCGSSPLFDEIESKLKLLKEVEEALILNSGFQANISLIPAIANRHSHIFMDKYAHNSLIQGAILSRAHVHRYRHNDLEHLEQLLRTKTYDKNSRFIIITESVFSMDGDQSDIDNLVNLSKKYQAILMVDDAHATGVMGKNGMGCTSGKKVDLSLGTFGKALGSFGAYVCCTKEMKNFLINRCQGLIYSTALPPPILGSIQAALQLVPKMQKERDFLQKKGEHFRKKMNAIGFSTGKSSSQIIPVYIGAERDALHLSAFLEKAGFLAIAIRPPTVATNASRIRIALSCSHTFCQIEKFVFAFSKWKKYHG